MQVKRNLFIMYAVALLHGMVFYAPVATLYRQAAGIGVFSITIIEGISLVLCLLLELPWGMVADRIGYRRTMIVCCLVYVVSKVVFWRAEGFGGFLLERVLLSVVTAGLSGVESSILYLSCGGEGSQKCFGIYDSLQTAGLLLAAGVWSVFLAGDYRLSALLTVFSHVGAAALAFGLREVRGETEAANVGAGQRFIRCLRSVTRDRGLLLFLLGAALLANTTQTICVFLNQPLYLRCGLSNTAIGYIYIGVTLLGLAGVFSARLTRRLGEQGTTRLLFLCAAAACGLMAFTTSAWLAVACVGLLRLSNNLFLPLQTELQNRAVRSDDRVTELSIHSVLMTSVGIFANLIFGRLADRNLGWALALGAVFCVAGLCVVTPLLRRSSEA